MYQLDYDAESAEFKGSKKSHLQMHLISPVPYNIHIKVRSETHIIITGSDQRCQIILLWSHSKLTSNHRHGYLKAPFRNRKLRVECESSVLNVKVLC